MRNNKRWRNWRTIWKIMFVCLFGYWQSFVSWKLVTWKNLTLGNNTLSIDSFRLKSSSYENLGLGACHICLIYLAELVSMCFPEKLAWQNFGSVSSLFLNLSIKHTKFIHYISQRTKNIYILKWQNFCWIFNQNLINNILPHSFRKHFRYSHSQNMLVPMTSIFFLNMILYFKKHLSYSNWNLITHIFAPGIAILQFLW